MARPVIPGADRQFIANPGIKRGLIIQALPELSPIPCSQLKGTHPKEVNSINKSKLPVTSRSNKPSVEASKLGNVNKSELLVTSRSNKPSVVTSKLVDKPKILVTSRSNKPSAVTPKLGDQAICKDSYSY